MEGDGRGAAVRDSEARWRGLFERLHEGLILGELVRDRDGVAVDWRYLDVNPNGSLNAIAGVANAAGNVVGLMPHPEHAVEPGFGPDTPAAMRSGVDGLRIFRSALEAVLA